MPLFPEETSFDCNVINMCEPHFAIALLLDTSGSMTGKPIARLNAGLKQFRDHLQMDEYDQRNVDICIISFNSTVTLLQDFTPLPNMQIPTLSAGGRTAMGAAINMAIDCVKKRCCLYNILGTPHYQPCIFMMTDGIPTDDISMARQRIQNEENSGKAGKLKFWSCGIANDEKDNIDYATLNTLSKRVIELENYDFPSLFRWIGNCFYAGDHDLPENVHLISPDIW